MDNLTNKAWNSHYHKKKSILKYPDENLVRILSIIQINTKQKKLKKALDLGCGSGRHIPLLQDFSYQVIAIDCSKKSIQIVKKNYSNIQAYSLCEPPYPIQDKELDLVIAWGVLHYLKENERTKILNEIHRVLKKGGYFAGTFRAIQDNSISIGKKNISQLKDLEGAFIQKFTANQIKKILKDFTDIKIGFMERTPLGNLKERISHYFFLARK